MRFLVRLVTILAVVASTGAIASYAAAAGDVTAVADAVSVHAGSQATVKVLANDTCAGAATPPCLHSSLSDETVTSAPGVTTTVNPSTGAVTVAVSPSHSTGTVPLSYTITDAAGTGSAAITVTVLPPAPVAVGDAVTVKLGGSAAVNVLRNDTCNNQTPCPASLGRVTLVKPLPGGITATVNPTTKVVTVKAAATRLIDNTHLTYRLTYQGASATARISLHVRATRWSPAHYSPSVAPTFNNPVGSKAARRAIIQHVNKTIDSVPGYRVRSRSQCPANPALWPSEIKISLYSIADMSFVDSLIRADRRCVSVQLLMNNHLDAQTSHSWGKLLHSVGNNRHARSWTYRCKGGCRSGHGVEHAKFYLFSRAGKRGDVVMVGSSNMTSNATHVQWNDLFTTYGAKLYADYRSVFEEMAPDHVVYHPFRLFTVGRYEAAFWPEPRTTAKTDQIMRWLRTISCTGATGGSGINGHTVVYINIHAWHSARGVWLAQEVRHLYNKGCYVRILYSFMGHGIFTYLKAGTGARMVVLRTIFPHDPPHKDAKGIVMAALYSHMKNFDVSGNVAGNSASWVSWTGSNNFTNLGTHSDEVVMRIASRRIYNRYVAHWKFIAKTRSSTIWKHYDEPQGGGRAPEETARRAAAFETGGRSGTPAQQMLRDDALPNLDTTGQDMD
ncbi:MAG: phospholipase D-like domain-containing protein [Nocardioidaceae bacterium]